MAKSDPEPVTAVWVRNIGNRIQMLVEIDGVWRVVVDDHHDCGESVISHIVEARAFRSRPEESAVYVTAEEPRS